MISKELWNRELYTALTESVDDDELSTENVIDRLQFHSEIGDNCDSEIEFCASHFSEFDSTDFCALPFEIFSAIVSHQSLRLNDEDSFFGVISSQISENPVYFDLLEFVRFEYLSAASIESFITLINESFGQLTMGIWRSVSRRLSFSVFPPSSAPSERFESANEADVCPFSSGSPMDGILTHLTAKHGGHLVDSGRLSITASGVGSVQVCPVRSLGTVGNQNVFFTPDAANSWVCYDFGDARISLTHYSIRNRCDYDGHHLRTWRLEGSVDGLSWTELDREENNERLSGKGTIASFAIAARHRKAFRMIRLQQTGKNSSGNDHLMLAGVEFFGVARAQSK
jgi:hypothetical protein